MFYSCEREIDPPAYLQYIPSSSYTVETSDDDEMMVRLDTDIEQQGLNLELLGLNDSQRDAYFSALTKQFSVIQGSYGIN